MLWPVSHSSSSNSKRDKFVLMSLTFDQLTNGHQLTKSRGAFRQEASGSTVRTKSWRQEERGRAGPPPSTSKRAILKRKICFVHKNHLCWVDSQNQLNWSWNEKEEDKEEVWFLSNECEVQTKEDTEMVVWSFWRQALFWGTFRSETKWQKWFHFS